MLMRDLFDKNESGTVKALSFLFAFTVLTNGMFCGMQVACVSVGSLPVSLFLQTLRHVGVVTVQLALHVLDGVLHMRLACFDLL